MLFKTVHTIDRLPSPAAQAWARFKRNYTAMFGLVVIAAACLVATLGYLITPDKTPYANDQKPELLILEPGSRVRLLKVRSNQPEERVGFFSTMLFGRPNDVEYYSAVRHYFRGCNVVVEEYTGNTPNHGDETAFNLADVVYALADRPVQYDSLRGTLTFFEWNATSPTVKTVSELRTLVENSCFETRTYLLGTDLLGRDLLSRLVIGTRISLSVGLISVVISIFIGVILGALAGYFRGKTDAFIMWLINVVWSLPTLLLVIAITLALGRGIAQVFIAVGLTMWVEAARIVRGQILSLREKEFVEAGRALGFGSGRIIFRHILPNVAGPIIVVAASNFAGAILTEAGLSFLGIGAQPPVPSWGEMVNAHHGYILMDKAWLAFIPGAAIMLLVLAFMLVGNGLRDALDTRAHDSKPIVSA